MGTYIHLKILMSGFIFNNLYLYLYLIMSHEAFKQFLVIITKLLYNKESFNNMLDINLKLFKIIISHCV